MYVGFVVVMVVKMSIQYLYIDLFPVKHRKRQCCLQSLSQVQVTATLGVPGQIISLSLAGKVSMHWNLF